MEKLLNVFIIAKKHPLFQTTNNYIRIRASKLPNELSELRTILFSKNLINFDYFHHLDFQFNAIKNFCYKNNISMIWSNIQNSKLYKIFYWKKFKSDLLNYNYVKKIIKPWKKNLCFVFLDKNLNT